MTGELRAAMDEFWEEAHRRSQQMKDPYVALEMLRERYLSVDEDDRPPVNEVLADWVTDQHPNKRYDAMAMVDEFAIVEAAPSLAELAEALARVPGPAAQDEREGALSLRAQLLEER